MRTAIFLLLALPLLASAQWFTDDEINGIASLCDVSTSNPGSHALTASACRDCTTNLAGATSTLEKSGRAYACHSVCQNNEVIDQQVASDGTVTTFSAADALTRANLCVGCLSRTGVTAYGCQHCLESNSDATDVSACMTCLESNPWAGSTDPTKSYLINSYQWACGQCLSIPAGAARDQCMACIASPTAQPLYPGILTADELALPGAITTDPTPTARDNDFGRCVYYANQTYLINSGSTEIQGIYDSCKSDLATSTKLECMQCMFAAEQGDQNPAHPTYNLQASPSKDWACASYCQNPLYQPSTIDLSTSQSSKCEACIQDPDVKDAWACGNCLQVSLVAGATTAMVDDCFTNVQDDPYLGYASNYNWAVGKCASIVSSTLRSLCMTCVRSQELPTVSGGTVTLSAAFNSTTEANICGCIDLIQNQTLVATGLDLARYDDQLNAIQRACFYKQVYYNAAGTLVQPSIPWGTTPYTASDGSTAYPCLECIATATQMTQPGGNNKAYGCTEYCQDPRLVTSVSQGEACSTCVKHPLVADPSGCKLCMEATSDDGKRAKCFGCVQSAFNGASNKAWGCSQCAQFANAALADDCYRCLELPGVDPCTCVDMSKNGTVHEFLGAQDCVPRLFRLWIWFNAGDSLATLPWSVDTSSVEFGIPATHLASGTATAPDATFVTTAFNGGVDIYSVDLPFSTGASFAGQSSLWLNVYDGVATPNSPAGIAWDWSQLPTGMPQGFRDRSGAWNDATGYPYGLATRLFDSCGNTLIDTVTQAAFIDPPGSGLGGDAYYLTVSDTFQEAGSLQISCPSPAFDAINPPVCI